MSAAAVAAPLVEVFRSVQGEGPHAGKLTVFVRTAVCPLRCMYCDSEHTFEPAARFRVHGGVAGSERWFDNPGSPEVVVGIVQELAGERPLWVSFTGGEPLVWPQFVAACARGVRGMGHRVLLETAALDVKALQVVIGEVDHLAADYKLPVTLEKGDPRAANRACIALGVERGVEVVVKVVVTADVDDGVWGQVLDELEAWRDAIVLVAQPVTPFRKEQRPVAGERVLGFGALAHARGFAVRVLPQVHRLLQVP
jgi:organic radical activating enzyme